nr:MAG TPA: hypothetical protein [Inoviridae sp.]
MYHFHTQFTGSYLSFSDNSRQFTRVNCPTQTTKGGQQHDLFLFGKTWLW